MKVNQDVLSYKHEGVIKRFKKVFPELESQAETIFSDLMKFFWAGRKHEQLRRQSPANEELDFLYIMDEEMKPIDEMWHIFLLFTKDYMDFCDKYFGEYLHHLPNIVGALEDKSSHNFQLNLERFLNFTYDLLGEETIRRWYSPILA